jgi:capsular exopolysaccharide synthesis family protein
MNQNTIQTNEDLNLKDLFALLFKYKWSIIFLTLLSTLLIFIYLYFQFSIYRSSALIEVKSNSPRSIISEGLSSESSAIGKEKIDKEIEILQTFYINNKVLDKINFNILYFIDSDFKKVEIYKDIPIAVEDIAIFDTKVLGKKIKIIPKDDGYHIDTSKSFFSKFKKYNPFYKKDKELHLDNSKLYKYNTIIETDYFALNIKKLHKLKNPIYIVLLGDNKHIFDSIKDNLVISQVTKFAPLIRVEFEDNVLERADKYVNTLIDIFIQQSIEDKGKKTEKIIEFIDQELVKTKLKLDEYESKLEEYKIKHNAIQPALQGTTYINQLSKIENQLSEYSLKAKLISNILNMAKKKESIDTITTSLMKLDDQPTMSLINKLQEIQIKEEELRAKYSYKHPSLRPIKKQIYHIRKNIIKNIKNLQLRVNQKIANIKKLKKSYKTKLNSLPTKEKRLVGLKRDYEVSSKIYNHLLKKKSENQMVKVATQSDYRVIDYAKNTEAIPIKPKRLFTLILGMLLGLIFGIIQAYLRNYFDDKIQSKYELEDATTLPIYGILPEVKKGKLKMEVIENPKSPYAESFRSLRTNLQFTQNKNAAQTILVTSTVMGEGKSTTTANLSAIFHLAGYKCIVINLDMRKPTLHRYFNVSNSIGMSTYLSGKNDIDQIIQTSEYDNLDVITSGPIPPNPSELIMRDRMKELIEHLKGEYDYIFIDSAPLGLVTDTMNLMPFANINLIIFRENYALKSYVKDLNSLVERHNLKRIGLILNGSDMSSGSYGYGYGY